MISQRIEAILTHYKISQTQMANLLGISPSNVSQYVSGVQIPAAPTLLLMSRIFKVSFQWLETGEGKMFENQSVLEYTGIKREKFKKAMSILSDIHKNNVTPNYCQFFIIDHLLSILLQTMEVPFIDS